MQQQIPIDWPICKKALDPVNRKGAKVLDVGCRDGTKIKYLLPDVEAVKLDLTRYSIDCFVRGSGLALPFADNVFDAVVCLHVIEHIREDKSLLCEFYRVLKPTGMLLLVTPNSNRPTKAYSTLLKLFSGSRLRYPMNPDHVFEYKRNDLVKLFSAYEFTFEVSPIFRWPIRLRYFCDQWVVKASKSNTQHI